MSQMPRDFIEEFPVDTRKIHGLIDSDPRFARLFDSYYEINQQVHQAVANSGSKDDLQAENLRKLCASLKEEIHRYLAT